MPKIINISYSDTAGGAAIGAMRFHKMLLKAGMQSELHVVQKKSDEPGVFELPQRPYRRKLAGYLSRKLNQLSNPNNPVARSHNLIPMGLSEYINNLDGDLIQFHWVGANALSIFEMAAIKKPVFWKLPDMWAFSGMTHYDLPNQHPRYTERYTKQNRDPSEKGYDTERWLWNIKKLAWREFHPNFIGPSQWITDCVQKSSLFKKSQVRHILNPLDLNQFKILDKIKLRKEFGIKQNDKILMFGALNALNDRRKGVHYLKNAFENLTKSTNTENIRCLIVGAKKNGQDVINDIPISYIETTHDPNQLAKYYNLADVFILPAEADNLPNVVKEASCCGVLCTGFNIGGMPDMISHLETGYLAKPFCSEELSQGIKWCIENASIEKSKLIRSKAEKRHDELIVSKQVLNYYNLILNMDH